MSGNEKGNPLKNKILKLSGGVIRVRGRKVPGNHR